MNDKDGTKIQTWNKEFLQERLGDLEKRDNMSDIDKQNREVLLNDLKIWKTQHSPAIPYFKAALYNLLKEKEFSGIGNADIE